MGAVVWVLQRGHSGDGCDLASTLYKYDLRKGDLFVLSVVVGRLPRPMEGNGVTPIFRSLQNC